MSTQEWIERAEKLGPELAEYSARHDEDGTFVSESFAALKADGLFAALVPKDLGGMGASVDDICEFIRVLAHHCPSTALAYSMHSHLVASTVWRHLHGKGGEPLLRKVAVANLVLVSTGANDWLDSGGVLTRVDGGYRFTANKGFASGSPMGDMMITSGVYEHPMEGPLVLHFPLPFSAAGVRRGDDWNAHGMRGSGSSTISIEGAFVADESIAVTRPRGAWNPAFDIICTLALPLVMSSYVGVAERAAALAIERSKLRPDDADAQYLTGQLLNELFITRALWRAQLANAANFDFLPSLERSSLGVQAKTTLADACVRTVDKAMELSGGAGYFRKHRIEALMRDVRAAPYHPMPAARQWRFSGRVALGLSPTPPHGA